MLDMGGKTIRVGDLLATWDMAPTYRVLSIDEPRKAIKVKTFGCVTVLRQCDCMHMAIQGHIRPLDDNLTRENVHEYNLYAANFSDRILTNYNFSGLDIRNASFHRAIIKDCKFIGSIIKHCIFEDTKIIQSNFYDANISNVSFDECYFKDVVFTDTTIKASRFGESMMKDCIFNNCSLDLCDFCRSVIMGNNFVESVFKDTRLSKAVISLTGFLRCEEKGTHADECTLGYRTACPDEGAFIGWKKCCGNAVVKLLITEDALRSSATSRKCRCSKATVLSIENLDGSPKPSNYVARSIVKSDFTYEVGKTVEVPDFDKDRWAECSSGIHFFITREEAVDYNLC